MMLENGSALAKKIANDIWTRSEPINLVMVLEDYLHDDGLAVDNLGVLSEFSELHRQVLKIIERKISAAKNRGLPPAYRISEIDPDFLIPQLANLDNKLRVQIKANIQQLSWRAFEYFCRDILRMTGVQDCIAMRGTKEEGIDLVGLIDLGEITKSAMWHKVQVRVLGQAKTGRIRQDDVRQFNQDIQSFREGRGKAYELAPTQFKHVDMAVVGFMFTRRNFTRGAKVWADDHNIATKDAEQMVEDLLRSSREIPELLPFEQSVLSRDRGLITYYEHLAVGTR